MAKINNNFLSNLLLNLFFFVLFLFSYALYTMNIAYYDLLKLFFLLHLITICIHSYWKYGFFSVYTLFLAFSVFFSYSSVFFDLINYFSLEEFTVIRFPQIYSFSMDTGAKFLFFSEIFFFELDILYTLLINKKIKNLFSYDENKSCMGKTQFINKYVYIAIICIFPLALYRMYKYFDFFRSNGYMYVLVNGIDENTIPNWTNGAVGLIYSLFLVLLIHPENKKHFVRACFFVMLCFLLQGAAGNRGSFLYRLFALIVVYVSFFSSKRVKVKHLLIIIIFCLVFAIYIGSTRNSTDNKQSVSIENILVDFFVGQSNSRGVLLSVIEDDIPYHTYPFIFSPIINSFVINMNDTNNRIDNIRTTNSINLLTAYKVSPKKTLTGGGLGGNVVAEFVDCGKVIGVLFGCFFLAFTIIFLERIRHVSPFLRPFSFVLISGMMHNPRGYFFGFIPEFKYALVAIILYLFFDLFYKTFSLRKKGKIT